MLQLNPPLVLETPKGKALALFVIDPGMEHDLQWVCALNENGECWTFRNSQIRFEKNITMGRLTTSEINPSKSQGSLPQPNDVHSKN